GTITTTSPGRATIPLTSNAYPSATAKSTISATTTTMTATSTATYSQGSASTITLSTGQQTGTTVAQQQPRQAPNGRFIEFFSNVTLRVSSPAVALDGASAIAYALGGYVAYSTLMNTTAFVV